MEKFTLDSFKKISENNRFDGGEPIIEYELVDYKQTDKDITISIDFTLNLMNLENIAGENKYNEYEEFINKYYNYVDDIFFKGHITYTISIDELIENNQAGDTRYHLYVGGSINNMTDRQLSFTKVTYHEEENNFTEKDKQIIEETIKEVCKNDYNELLDLVITNARLQFKEPKKDYFRDYFKN